MTPALKLVEAEGPRTKSVEDARKPGAHAVVSPGEVRHVRHGFAPVRRRDDRSRHRLVELPILDVDDEMHQDSFSLERRQRRAGRRKLIGNPWICH